MKKVKQDIYTFYIWNIRMMMIKDWKKNWRTLMKRKREREKEKVISTAIKLIGLIYKSVCVCIDIYMNINNHLNDKWSLDFCLFVAFSNKPKCWIKNVNHDQSGVLWLTQWIHGEGGKKKWWWVKLIFSFGFGGLIFQHVSFYLIPSLAWWHLLLLLTDCL